MYIAPFDSQARAAVEEVIKHHDFLSLVNSKTHYPDSRGSGLPLLLVETPLCSAVISLQGAQLLEFKSADSVISLRESPYGVAFRFVCPGLVHIPPTNKNPNMVLSATFYGN
jgi:glucose-6-phosphate 1-epimerase